MGGGRSERDPARGREEVVALGMESSDPTGEEHVGCNDGRSEEAWDRATDGRWPGCVDGEVSWTTALAGGRTGEGEERESPMLEDMR